MITREPVTIYGQTFVYDDKKGWIDKKSKKPADEGLLDMLNSLSGPLESPLRKLKTKISDSVEPVTISGTTFVFDLNQGWIDSKTKKVAPPHMQEILDNAVGIDREKTMGVEQAIDSVDPTTPTGIVGEAAVDKIKKKPKEKEKVDSKKEESQEPVERVTTSQEESERSDDLTESLEELVQSVAAIAMLMDKDLENKKRSARRGRLRARQGIIGRMMPDFIRQFAGDETSGGARTGALLATAAIGAIAMTFEPVREVVASMIDVFRGMFSTVTSAFASLGTGISRFAEATAWMDNFKFDLKDPEGNPETIEQRTARIADDIREEGLGTVRETTQEEKDEFDRNLEEDGGILGRLGQMLDPSEWFTIRREEEPEDASRVQEGRSPELAPQVVERETTMGDRVAPVQERPIPNVTPTVPPANDPLDVFRPEPEESEFEGAPPRRNIRSLEQWLIRNGFETNLDLSRGNPNSSHGYGRAIDVNIGVGNVEARDPEMRARFDALADELTAAGYNVLWRVRGHYDHIHVQLGTRGVRPGSFWKGGGDTSRGGGEVFPVDEETSSVQEGRSDSLLPEINANTINRVIGNMIGGIDAFDTTFKDFNAYKSTELNARSVDKRREEINIREQIATPPPVVDGVSTMEKVNLNRDGGSAKVAATTNDNEIIRNYLRYFGVYQM